MDDGRQKTTVGLKMSFENNLSTNQSFPAIVAYFQSRQSWHEFPPNNCNAEKQYVPLCRAVDAFKF